MFGSTEIFQVVIGEDTKVIGDWVGLVDKEGDKKNGKNLKERIHNLFGVWNFFIYR